jgi:tetratricopeptide (TPR) repeat protein
VIVGSVVAQNPTALNFAMASHPVVATKFTTNGQTSAIFFRLTNQIDGGYFCLSPQVEASNTVRKYQRNRSKMLGMPTCPDVHKFQTIGETIDFELDYKSFPKNLLYVDILEKCDDNCLEIRGLVLNDSLNSRINMAYAFFEESKFEMAAAIYESLAMGSKEYPFGIHLFNAIHAYAQCGKFTEAKLLYNKLKASNFVDTNQLLGRLRMLPYFSKLL